jgi:molybdenum cofactor biosynthesis enzyme MoaA
MEHILKQDLYQVILGIENDRFKQGLLPGHRFHARSITRQELVAKAWTVLNILKSSPYLSGRDVCDKSGLDKNMLAVIYKMIQRSNICQDHLQHSDNRDYFKVIKHYFNHNFYTVVFFVGTNCPSRCIYCPSVRIDNAGRRHLKTYDNYDGGTLTEKIFCRVFDDLARIKSNGTTIMIKISGGLEPLTDVATMEWIIRFADQLEIPVKLFSNGLLFNDPERRKVALKTEDIRISLSTTDENQYQYICFSDKKGDEENQILPRLKESIQRLVKERPLVNPDCKIGLNCIVRPENHGCLIPLIEMAKEFGIDYIDFKPDYFSSHDGCSISRIDQSVQEARSLASSGAYSDLFINFTGSLSRNHLYWQSWNGTCNTLRQSDFKIFITPFGHCSPVHYGAFPHSDISVHNNPDSYSIGEINEQCGLLDVLTNPSPIPEIELKKLNPFELMLSLEIAREGEDHAWGLPLCVSPYHTSQSDQIPVDLFFPFEIKE